MKRFLSILVFLLIPAVAFPSSASQKGIQVKMRSGEVLTLYERSYALVIGIGNYTAGWPKLLNISKELDPVVEVLEAQGFHVVRKNDLKGAELEDAFRGFIYEHGYDRNNRLLFFFSGHGHTLGDGSKGYLVPSDAPDPREDERGFLRKALSMDQILAWSRDMSAIHALFLFDSCFSGTIFRAKDLPEVPPDISMLTIKPVRQYLTAGDAGEPVPAKSTFTPVFVDGLKYGLADMDKDGYVTGSELGLFLRKEVSKRERQTPQFGKIPDYELSRGDFVFVAGGSAVITRPDPPPAGEPVTGSLKVITRPAGAKVYVKEGFVGASPVELKGLSMGQVSVRASLSGYQEEKETVWIQAGKETQVTLLLNPIPTTGSLEVRSEPSGALWYLDGAYVGTTPGDMASVPQGSRKVTVNKEGFQDWEQTVTITVGATRKVQANLVPIRKDSKPGDVTVSVTVKSSSKEQADLVPIEKDSKLWDVWLEPTTGMEFVWVPGGCYMMGQSETEQQYLIRELGEEYYNNFFADELPHHEVCVDGFWMGRTEVTVDQFRRFVEATGYRTDAERDGGCYDYVGFAALKRELGASWQNPRTLRQKGDYPVTCVSWNDVKEYIQFISKGSIHEFRLPTEAEWEYACRGNTTSIRFWGDDPDQACKYANVSNTTKMSFRFFRKGSVASVGLLAVNPFGLYDMLGNVWEWCEDHYDEDAYSNHFTANPIHMGGGADRVIRGGGWRVHLTFVRCASRYGAPLDYPYSDLGFRLLRIN